MKDFVGKLDVAPVPLCRDSATNDLLTCVPLQTIARRSYVNAFKHKFRCDSPQRHSDMRGSQRTSKRSGSLAISFCGTVWRLRAETVRHRVIEELQTVECQQIVAVGFGIRNGESRRVGERVRESGRCRLQTAA